MRKGGEQREGGNRGINKYSYTPLGGGGREGQQVLLYSVSWEGGREGGVGRGR